MVMNFALSVSKHCTNEMEKMKIQKAYRYIIFKLSEDMKEILVEECGSRDATYEDMRVKLLGNAECRYAACDLQFDDASGKPKSEIVFISWTPESSLIRPKMIYTSTRTSFKRTLKLIFEVQATDADELDIENAIEKAKKA